MPKVWFGESPFIKPSAKQRAEVGRKNRGTEAPWGASEMLLLRPQKGPLSM